MEKSLTQNFSFTISDRAYNISVRANSERDGLEVVRGDLAKIIQEINEELSGTETV